MRFARNSVAHHPCEKPSKLMKPQQPTTFPRLLAQAVGVCLISVLAILVLFQSTTPPPPRVALVFTGFAEQGGEAGAVLTLINARRGSVSFHDPNWWAEITTAGSTRTWQPESTNFTSHLLAPRRHQEFFLPLPTDATHWRAVVPYFHLERRDLLVSLDSWLRGSGVLEHLPNRVSDAISSGLKVVVADPWKANLASLPFQTNFPPIKPPVPR